VAETVKQLIMKTAGNKVQLRTGNYYFYK
jgi:hypothetical protein